MRAHYDSHLAAVYTWMAGGTEVGLARGRALLAELDLPAGAGSLAVDLGCGPGFHAVPLAELGYRVLACDTCEPLLVELRALAGDRPIRTVNADLREFRRHLTAAPTVVFCLGDTLTHLPDPAAVTALASEIAAALTPGGRCVLAFRDYAGRELTGPARFLPVRNEPGRLFTCFLEYHPDHVLVHDLWHEFGPAGWTQRVSAYRKLRLDPAWVVRQFAAAGLRVAPPVSVAGMTRLTAWKS
jgi:SAM-dependent methyltransferase